jgi:hypothetical protein
MFLDTSTPGGPGGEPWTPTCRSCRAPLAPDDNVERIEFAANDNHQLADMNGLYHEACARPILSVKRAYDMLGRLNL